MNNIEHRRNFLKAGVTAAVTAGFGTLPFVSAANGMLAEPSPFMIGPIAGYTTHIGTLVTMLNYNRVTVVGQVKDLSVTDLDYLLDPRANSIGALLMHLAATEKFYQINTFEGRQQFNAEESIFWNAAMRLGDEGRQKIKGKPIAFYLDLLEKGRKKTLDEFKKKDDKWLLAIDPIWSKKEKLNTYWKWFHVCEHEANHRGQISFLKSRLPGAKTTGPDG
jgi:uncharacterized damage-inducible protein DinB